MSCKELEYLQKNLFSSAARDLFVSLRKFGGWMAVLRGVLLPIPTETKITVVAGIILTIHLLDENGEWPLSYVHIFNCESFNDESHASEWVASQFETYNTKAGEHFWTNKEF